MFRNFVYLDEEKMYSYLRQIDKEYANQPSEVNIRKTKGGKLSVYGIGLGAEHEIEERRKGLQVSFVN